MVEEATNCAALDSSNIGFKLLKKHGWQEGTGLGAFQQGRLEPVEAHVKKNKRGLGAEIRRKKTSHSSSTTNTTPLEQHNTEKKSKKEKALSKRMRKMLDEEKRRQDNEFRQAFFREFWPDNV